MAAEDWAEDAHGGHGGGRVGPVAWRPPRGGTWSPGGVAPVTAKDHGPDRAVANMIQVAKLLSRTEERLVETERDLILAVKHTISATEGMIRLVRSTTATTHALMAPLRLGCPLSRCQSNLQCMCDRVTMAKSLVKVVEGLNETAGCLNVASNFMIRLSQTMSPKRELTESCVDFLDSKIQAAEEAVLSISRVQSQLQVTVQKLGATAAGLSGLREVAVQAESVPDVRLAASTDLLAMIAGATSANQQLQVVSDTLRSSARFLKGVLLDLNGLQVCPEAGAVLLEQMECPVCYQLPAPPVWACCNGHIVCASCRAGVLGGCPTCRGVLDRRPALLLSAWAASLSARRVSQPSLADHAEHRDDDDDDHGDVEDDTETTLSDRDKLAAVEGDDERISTRDDATGADGTTTAVSPSPSSERLASRAPEALDEDIEDLVEDTLAVGLSAGDDQGRVENNDNDTLGEMESLRHSGKDGPEAKRKRPRTRRKVLPCSVM